MKMRSLNLGIEMDQGADFKLVIGIFDELGATDITGYSFLGQMRPTTELTNPVIPPVAEFSFSVLNQFTNKGQVNMTLPIATVNAIPLSVADQLQNSRLKTPFMFDVKMKDVAGKVTRILGGLIFVSPQATQEVFT